MERDEYAFRTAFVVDRRLDPELAKYLERKKEECGNLSEFMRRAMTEAMRKENGNGKRA